MLQMQSHSQQQHPRPPGPALFGGVEYLDDEVDGKPGWTVHPTAAARAESLVCTVHSANLRGPLRPTGGVDVPIPHCLRCERAGSRHGELHRESVAPPALVFGLRVGQGQRTVSATG